MILGPVSYLDCIVFCVFLTPQLLIHVGLLKTVSVVLRCLPFLLIKLPYEFIRERFFISRNDQTPFVRKATPFEDFVIRCVRYAFANIPSGIGRVFFTKPVALPFLRFRMLRHGYLKSPVRWDEHTTARFKGIWIRKNPSEKPDICIFYAHGGGFSMGSCFFYLEFLLTWASLLTEAGYRNPAIFALDYTLVPDGSFPTQLEEAIASYEHVLSMVGDPSRICLSGDSAGATIMLSLLLHLSNLSRHSEEMDGLGSRRLPKPGMAALISPWITLVSDKHRNTASDYLNVDNLHQYARQYSGGRVAVDDPLVSPGNCRDVSWWRYACPDDGIHVAYGAEEVLSGDVQDFVKFLEANHIKVSSRREVGDIHAWPVACLFLSTAPEERKRGLKNLISHIREQI
ncbi:hypothetical protein DL767_004665 [Monosporascus sp. MG133]|nr:hypothetical protein DL767_004665 [Monosporascus sp. MG133]